MPFFLPALGAALLVKAIAGHKKASSQAEAARAADNERVDVQNKQKKSKLHASASLLKGVQGSLRAGAPQYGVDPATLAEMEATPATWHSPDPTKGVGWGTLEGAAGSAADIFSMGLANQRFGRGTRTYNIPGSVPGPEGMPGTGADPYEEDLSKYFQNWGR